MSESWLIAIVIYLILGIFFYGYLVLLYSIRVSRNPVLWLGTPSGSFGTGVALLLTITMWLPAIVCRGLKDIHRN